MKVYVSELPESCKDCFFCEHIEENVDGKGRDEVACYFEGFLNNVLLGETFNAKNCKHLQSLSDYTKQVRKEVVQEIKAEFELSDVNHISESMYPPTEEAMRIGKGFSACKERLFNKLDQIQGQPK